LALYFGIAIVLVLVFLFWSPRITLLFTITINEFIIDQAKITFQRRSLARRKEDEMRILLTGASGKVGSYTLQYLLRNGHTVTSTDIVPLPPKLQSTLPTTQQEKHHIVDLASVSATDALFEKVGPLDGVIHIGAIPDPAGKDWRWVHNNNTASSYNVLYTAGVKHGIKRISQASSVNATGLSYTREGMQEFDEFPITEKETYRGVSSVSPRFSMDMCS
jgi:nucleoside-diphosphate-sugar epimerase